jgi:hypothetical protein
LHICGLSRCFGFPALRRGYYRIRNEDTENGRSLQTFHCSENFLSTSCIFSCPLCQP